MRLRSTLTHGVLISLASSTSAQRPSSWRMWNLIGLAVLTAYSTALGWQAQMVSYPLFRAVPSADFADYHQRYNETIPWVVIAPGFVTFLAGAVFPWTRPRQVSGALGAVVSATSVISLLSTVLWAIPRHDILDREGPSDSTIDGLLDANLIRSLALTSSTIALSWAAGRLITEPRTT